MEVLYGVGFLVLLSAIIVGVLIRRGSADRESKWIYSAAGIAVLLALGVLVFAIIAWIWAMGGAVGGAVG
jgi:hypothetical protein